MAVPLPKLVLGLSLLLALSAGPTVAIYEWLPPASVCDSVHDYTPTPFEGVPPPMPTLPDQYRLNVQANILQKGWSSDVTEYYDGPNNRAAVFLTFNGTTTQTIFNYKTMETYDIFPDGSCKTRSGKADLFGFFTMDRNHRPIKSTVYEMFHMDPKQNFTYVGNTWVRGVRVNHWTSCQEWSDFNAKFQLDYYFSHEDYQTPWGMGQIPIRAVVNGSAGNEDKNQNHMFGRHKFEHIYDFTMDVGPIEDQTVFQLPHDVICPDRKDYKALPNIPDNFQMDMEMNCPVTGKSMPFHHSLRYDWDHRMVENFMTIPGPQGSMSELKEKMGQHNGGALPGRPNLNKIVMRTMSTVDDHNTGLRYVTEKMNNTCRVMAMPKEKDAMPMDHGRALFNIQAGQKTGNSPFTYQGRSTFRNIPVDVWGVDTDGMIHKVFFLADDREPMVRKGQGDGSAGWKEWQSHNGQGGQKPLVGRPNGPVQGGRPTGRPNGPTPNGGATGRPNGPNPNGGATGRPNGPMQGGRPTGRPNGPTPNGGATGRPNGPNPNGGATGRPNGPTPNGGATGRPNGPMQGGRPTGRPNGPNPNGGATGRPNGPTPNGGATGRPNGPNTNGGATGRPNGPMQGGRPTGRPNGPNPNGGATGRPNGPTPNGGATGRPNGPMQGGRPTGRPNGPNPTMGTNGSLSPKESAKARALERARENAKEKAKENAKEAAKERAEEARQTGGPGPTSNPMWQRAMERVMNGMSVQGQATSESAGENEEGSSPSSQNIIDMIKKRREEKTKAENGNDSGVGSHVLMEKAHVGFPVIVGMVFRNKTAISTRNMPAFFQEVMTPELMKWKEQIDQDYLSGMNSQKSEGDALLDQHAMMEQLHSKMMRHVGEMDMNVYKFQPLHTDETMFQVSQCYDPDQTSHVLLHVPTSYKADVLGNQAAFSIAVRKGIAEAMGVSYIQISNLLPEPHIDKEKNIDGTYISFSLLGSPPVKSPKRKQPSISEAKRRLVRAIHNGISFKVNYMTHTKSFLVDKNQYSLDRRAFLAPNNRNAASTQNDQSATDSSSYSSASVAGIAIATLLLGIVMAVAVIVLLHKRRHPEEPVIPYKITKT